MVTFISSFNRLSNQDLLREVGRLAARERDATTDLVASLAVLDRRRLYLAQGYGSLFVYCTQHLHLSESATYKRIAAARAAQRFPVIFERFAAGDVTLTAIRLLAPHLTEVNHVALLDEVRHCSTRSVEQIVARLQPRPDVPSTVRKLPAPLAASHTVQPATALATPAQTESPPAPSAAGSESPSSCQPAATGAAETRREPPARPLPPDRPRDTLAPLTPTRYKVSFTIGTETYAKLHEAQDLLRHVIPDGDVAALFDRALTLLLRDAAKTKHASTERPRAQGAASVTPKLRSRHIPAEVKRRVWARDGGQCTFVSASGQRCSARGFLEYHHCVPYAAGGAATVENIFLRCRAHNAHEAEQAFGPRPPTVAREQRARYGGDEMPASEMRARVQVRDVFAVPDAACPHLRAQSHSRACNWPRGQFVEVVCRPRAGRRWGTSCPRAGPGPHERARPSPFRGRLPRGARPASRGRSIATANRPESRLKLECSVDVASDPGYLRKAHLVLRRFAIPSVVN